MTAPKIDKADAVRAHLAKIIHMAPAVGTYDADTFILDDWRRRCRDMASEARLALHELDKSDAGKP